MVTTAGRRAGLYTCGSGTHPGGGVDIPKAGDFHTFDFLGESTVVVRGKDGGVKAFANVCRHRAARLLDGPSGRCARIVCPYHAWTYSLDGRLIGVPHLRDLRGPGDGRPGPGPGPAGVYRGFVFVRLEPEPASVAEMMAPYDHELAPIASRRWSRSAASPCGRAQVNWKNISDNYSDGLHIPSPIPA
jgi:phenylpropionate dioxygenase-like ring-hydroxylating dioxygenase large terminal subunit